VHASSYERNYIMTHSKHYACTDYLSHTHAPGTPHTELPPPQSPRGMQGVQQRPQARAMQTATPVNKRVSMQCEYAV